MQATWTLSHTQTHSRIYQGNGTEEKGFKKRKAFKEDLKELTEVEWWLETGSWFQITGAWYEKGHQPLDFVWKDGILNTPVFAEEWIMGGALGTGNSSVVRALDSWLKGLGFETWQEWRENFLLQANFVCWLIPVFVPFAPPHPPPKTVTTVMCKRSWSFCQKYRWQVTSKQACTLCMWLCMKWHNMVHGCTLYTIWHADWVTLLIYCTGQVPSLLCQLCMW